MSLTRHRLDAPVTAERRNEKGTRRQTKVGAYPDFWPEWLVENDH